MAEGRDTGAFARRAFARRATIAWIAALFSVLQLVLLTAAVGAAFVPREAEAHGLSRSDCRAAKPSSEAPPPACPPHQQCCLFCSADCAPKGADSVTAGFSRLALDAAPAARHVENAPREPCRSRPFAPRAPPARV